MMMSELKGNHRAAAGWGAQIPAIWLAIYGAYLGVLYRTASEFKRIASNNIISNVLGFGALAFVKIWGYWGLAARMILQNASGVHLLRIYAPSKIKAALDIKNIVALAKISLPLAIPSYISTSCLSASLNLIIITYCGQSALGIYGVALVMQSMAMTFTMAIHQIFITRLTYKFGETGDVTACLKWSKYPTLLSFGAATVLAIALCVVIAPIIRLAMPKYEEAIPVIRILAVQLPLTAVALPLLIIQAALWYKSASALTLTRVGTCLAAIAVLPKSLEAIAAGGVFWGLCALIVGFGILRYRR
jgi:hypothetical protein